MTFLNTISFAKEINTPCQFQDLKIILGGFKDVDCKMASKIVESDKELEKIYLKQLDKNLSKEIAKISAETIEDISLIDSFFDQNGIDISEHEGVRQSCKLEDMSEPKCDSKINQVTINERISRILENESVLPKGNSQNIPNTFRGRLIAKANSIRDAKNTNEKSCPVNGSSGNFILKSFFTLADAKEFIESYKKYSTEEKLQKLNEFPQFKLVAKNKKLLEMFERSMLSYNPSQFDEKTFIESFFKNREVQQLLGDSLSAKCNNLKKNISTFVCKDNRSIPLLKEKDRFDLFIDRDKDDVDYDDNDLLAREVSRGLSCKYEDQINNGEKSKDNPLLKSSVGDLVYSIKSDLRINEKQKVFAKNVKNFCDLYLCKNESAQAFSSCKGGGPINSYDLLKTCNGNDKLSCELNSDTKLREKCFTDALVKCDMSQQKYLSYVKMRERDAINANNIPLSLAGIETTNSNGDSSTSGSESGKVVKPRGYSNFFQNFLGVEGTLIAEGKKPTAAAIADKVADFKERNLDVSGSGASLSDRAKVTLGSDINGAAGAAQSLLGTQGQQLAQADSQQVSGQGQGQVETNDANRRAREALQSSLIEAYSRPDRTPSSVVSDQKTKKSVARIERETSDEDDATIKGMRAQLDDILGSIKSLPPSEQLKTIAANNQSITGGGNDTSADDFRNKAEQDRLDKYRDRLKKWDQELGSWSSELRRKEFDSSWGSPTAANAPVSGTGINPKSSAASAYPDGGSGSGLKLTAVNGASGNGLKVDPSKAVLGQPKAGANGLEEDDMIVSSEKLSELNEADLKSIGVKSKDSFIIRVRHLDKIYAIPVKSLVHDGKSMFVPMLSEQTQNLAKIVLESPLFADYRDYQAKIKL